LKYHQTLKIQQNHACLNRPGMEYDISAEVTRTTSTESPDAKQMGAQA
jgi:hypothetical protein